MVYDLWLYARIFAQHDIGTGLNLVIKGFLIKDMKKITPKIMITKVWMAYEIDRIAFIIHMPFTVHSGVLSGISICHLAVGYTLANKFNATHVADRIEARKSLVISLVMWSRLTDSQHDQIRSINLIDCNPWLCAWDVCYIIFCCLLHIHSGKTGILFSLLFCSLLCK